MRVMSSPRVNPFSMHRRIFCFCALAAVGRRAFASGTLTFEGKGYSVEMVVGYDRAEVIGQVSFAPPGSRRAVLLPRESVRVVRFDSHRQLLELHYLNPGDAALPASFSLWIDKRIGTLLVDGRRIRAEFEWAM
jgi:hypothetical protein